MIEENNIDDCHCHSIRILEHECINCGKVIKKGKILLLDKSKFDSEITLSESVKSQVKKFEEILSSNNNLSENKYSSIHKSCDDLTKSNHINCTHSENQNNFIEKVLENGYVSIEHSEYETNAHESGKNFSENGFLVEKRHSVNSNHSIKSNHSNNLTKSNLSHYSFKSIHSNKSNDKIECQTPVQNNFDHDNETVLSFDKNTIENKSVHDNLSLKHETYDYDHMRNINKELCNSTKSLASSTMTSSTFKSNKSFPAPIPPARTIKDNKIMTTTITENDNVTYFKKIENNNNIETFEKNNLQQDQYFTRKLHDEKSEKTLYESSETLKHKENNIDNIVKQNHSLENTTFHKNNINDLQKNTLELDNLTRSVHNDVILLSKKTKLLEKLSKNLNNDTIDLPKDARIDFKYLKEKYASSEKIIDEKSVENSNGIVKSTTYYEVEKNTFEKPNDGILSRNKESRSSSFSDFKSSLKAEVVDRNELPGKIIQIEKTKNNVFSESHNQEKEIAYEITRRQECEKNFFSCLESLSNDKVVDNNNLEKHNSPTYYHSKKTSHYEPSVYEEYNKNDNNAESILDLRKIKNNTSLLHENHPRQTPNSYVYGSECEKNTNKLRYWKDKLVQESVIDETYEDLTLYKPKMIETICPITNTKKIIIGGESKTDQFKTILLFGLPNCGKTSLVNRICNYLYGTDRSTLLRLVVKFPSELHRKQHEIITYQFNNSLLPYNFVIIDTPGCVGDDNGGQFTYKQLYHTYIKPLVNSKQYFTIDAVLICLRLNSDCFNRHFNHQIRGLKKIINGQNDSNNILSIFTDSDDKYDINAMNDFHRRQISRDHGLFLIHSKSYLNAKHGFSHLDYIRIFEQSESELFKLFMYLEYDVIPTKLVKNERSEILV
ncbi:GTP binding domain and P-loop containing nucleoside triphosphate hydrolase domain-containing protein [Strongyloides ratti]|uniref:GTP binding domain and P-loop containing nucleoside triphosphate hydrolase domain-containing protein n=1 Tax=Strongyloides ratti TaxID=34506 RepID=A0A090MYW0_STRRB|nr:GTP binding domain and P-loop containing nucleoside triphosphate hydrolase domain-containing protein [Strongyloides ratti]CEF67869.1 GTP binding domain and P-loop containing nucleoside triphosphate hydrolase domain-containing protein [Strongyloides ratti]